MKTVLALAAKYLMTFVFAVITFNYFAANPLSWIALVALAGTIINYIVGDLLILPGMGNIAASIGDGVMAAAVAYLFGFFFFDFQANLTALTIFGILTAAGEYFFHIYLEKTEAVAP